MYSAYQKPPFEIHEDWKKDYHTKGELKFWPSSVLLKVAQPVEKIDRSVMSAISKMGLVLKSSGGVGLAAPQVNISKRIVIVSPRDNQPIVLINPVIVAKSDDTDWDRESCLSLPGLYGDIQRHTAVSVKHLDTKGNEVITDFCDYAARIVQHEIDHLDGILIIERMSFYSWKRK